MKNESFTLLLKCPTCSGDLIKRNENYVCPNQHKWDIVNSIPRFINGYSNYTDAFGIQWNKYKKTQLDSYTGTDISSSRLFRCLGNEILKFINKSKKVKILEVGCGAGRFTEVLLSFKNCYVTSIDYSNAVDANLDNFPSSSKHQILQCDINNSPFDDSQFDVVLALGMVQHTYSPDLTIKNIFKLIKPGGYLVFDHYTPSFSYFTKSTMFFRPFLKRMKPSTGMRITERLVNWFFPIHYRVRNHRVLQAILSRFSPVRTYFHSFPDLAYKYQYEFSLLDTHDSLTDFYKHFRTKSQIKKLLMKLRATNISINKGGNGIEARCTKKSLN